MIDEAVKDMLAALTSFRHSTYLVRDDKIAYVEGESIVDNVNYGYNTVWSYYLEHEKGLISATSLEHHVGMPINCGTFSYAEMPLDFAFISGVTGTLRTLAAKEKEILERVYKIKASTFLPSVFGINDRQFDTHSDVLIESQENLFAAIRREIDTMRKAKRAILVFFVNEAQLLDFHTSPQFGATLRNEAQILSEKVASQDRELCIKRATSESKVTLLTRTFGRGTDFICRSQQVLANGGLHVLQTFFSEEWSEEVQIMGRAARQGERGSFRIILLDQSLEWVVGSAWQPALAKLQRRDLYTTLSEWRNEKYEAKCGGKELGIEQCRREHTASKECMSALLEGKMDVVWRFLGEQNRGALLQTNMSRTMLLMDATGSMAGLLAAAKETVCTMFERAALVLDARGIASDEFLLQFSVYRDYDCKLDGILDSSSWEAKPHTLREFMAKVSARGGGDYEEAIEIGLWHAVKQSEEEDGISQVILIGDAPAKDKSAISRDRIRHGGEKYWAKSKFGAATHYENELAALKLNGIPVHAFYLTEGARANFAHIAERTGGRCAKLNINSPDGAEQLTHLVTEEILRKAAGAQGDEAVETYREKFVRTFTS